MKILKTSISAFFVAATVVSGALFVVQPSVADTSDSRVAPSSLKTSVVNRAITESEVLAAQRAWGDNRQPRLRIPPGRLPGDFAPSASVSALPNATRRW